MTIEKITKINDGLTAFLTLIALHFLWLSVTLLGGSFWESDQPRMP